MKLNGNRGRIWRLLACVGCVGGCSWSILTKDLPVLNIGIHRSGGNYVFSVTVCPDRTRGVGMEQIRVFDGSWSSGKTSCVVRRQDRGASPIFGKWTYGEVPSGYEKLGECTPLKPGATYTVEMVGERSGSRQFTLEADGSVRGVPSSCQ
jgi:hypothetical protein